jgi:hypothetical protein
MTQVSGDEGDFSVGIFTIDERFDVRARLCLHPKFMRLPHNIHLVGFFVVSLDILALLAQDFLNECDAFVVLPYHAGKQKEALRRFDRLAAGRTSST